MSTRKRNNSSFWHLGEENGNTGYFGMSDAGELTATVEGKTYNIHKIAKTHGTPAKIFFPEIMEKRVRDIIATARAHMTLNKYQGGFSYFYPMKANQSKEFVMAALKGGAHLEVASVNELFLVKQLLGRKSLSGKLRITCNGQKDEAYIRLIEQLNKKGVAIVPIIEDAAELKRLQKFDGEVGIRVDLSVKTKGHWDKRFNKFGFAEEDLFALGSVKNLTTLHYHISSQIEHMDDVITPLKRAFTVFAKLQEKNPGLHTLDVGGGAGIPYTKAKHFYTGAELLEQIVKAAKDAAEDLEIKHPNLIVEWGRYVAAPAQITVYRVLSDKDAQNKGKSKWYVIDGSFINDLADTWALKQKWHVVPANHMQHPKLDKVWLAGSSCDSDDKYTNGGSYVSLPRFTDCSDLLVAFFDTGAYQDALASYHCLLSSPVKLIAAHGTVKVARKRESPEEVGKKFGW